MLLITKRIVLITILFAASVHSALIYIPGVPVNKLTLIKTQVALNRWTRQLNSNYGTPKENPYRVKTNTDRVVKQLDNLNKELSQYNNVVIGDKNALAGSKNLIIGSDNTLLGNNNFVFSSNFNSLNTTGTPSTTAINNVLVNDQWIAELDRRDQIIPQLHEVIYEW